MTAQITAALQSLKKTAENIESLNAWLVLKRSETRPHTPPVCQMHDPTEADLKSELGWFLKSADEIGHALANMPEAQVWRYRSRLHALEQRVQVLNLTGSLKY